MTGLWQQLLDDPAWSHTVDSSEPGNVLSQVPDRAHAVGRIRQVCVEVVMVQVPVAFLHGILCNNVHGESCISIPKRHDLARICKFPDAPREFLNLALKQRFKRNNLLL